LKASCNAEKAISSLSRGTEWWRRAERGKESRSFS
jgi:hypothetical protein